MRHTNRRSILLAASLGALLLVIGTSAFAVWSNARTSQERVLALQKAHLETNVALTAIRESVYRSAILTRDYLLDSDASHAGDYTEQFKAIQASTERNFQTLESSRLNEDQAGAVARVRKEVNAYWDPTEVILDWTPEERRAQRSKMLRQRVGRRQEIFALTEGVERLVAANFDNERRKLTTADRDFRTSLVLTTGIALILGMAIAGGTFMRMLTLERQSAIAESELRRLSGQIRTAQEQERKYLSRELHDQVGQMLTGVRMELTAIARLHGDPGSEVASRIASAKGNVEQTLRIVRDVAMLLRPSMLDNLGLAPALAWLVREMSRSSGIEIDSTIEPGTDSIPDAYRTCIYRVVQEALTNCVRHSGATAVEVFVGYKDGWVVGTIVDNGRGFEVPTRGNRGLGLLGMEERVREIGGSIKVEASPKRGTRVEFRLPPPHVKGGDHDTDSDRGRSRDCSDRLEASA